MHRPNQQGEGIAYQSWLLHNSGWWRARRCHSMQQPWWLFWPWRWDLDDWRAQSPKVPDVEGRTCLKPAKVPDSWWGEGLQPLTDAIFYRQRNLLRPSLYHKHQSLHFYSGAHTSHRTISERLADVPVWTWNSFSSNKTISKKAADVPMLAWISFRNSPATHLDPKLEMCTYTISSTNVNFFQK